MSAIELIVRALHGDEIAVKGETAYAVVFTETPFASVMFCYDRVNHDGYDVEELSELEFSGYDGVLPRPIRQTDIMPACRLVAGEGLPLDKVYTDYFYRTKAELSAVYMDETASVAVFADYIIDDSAVLGSVVVDKDKRGERLGIRLAASVAGQYDRAYVICEPKLADVYGEYGFVYSRPIFKYIRRKNGQN